MGLALGLAVLGLSQPIAVNIIHELSLARKEISFEQLVVGDRVTVDVESKGCFNTRRYLLEFQMGETLKVRNLTPEMGRELEFRHWMPLTRDDSRRLDNLVNFYLNPPNCGWTIQEDINISFYRHGNAIRKEQFVTWKCPIDRPNLLSVYEILERIHVDNFSKMIFENFPIIED